MFHQELTMLGLLRSIASLQKEVAKYLFRRTVHYFNISALYPVCNPKLFDSYMLAAPGAQISPIFQEFDFQHSRVKQQVTLVLLYGAYFFVLTEEES